MRVTIPHAYDFGDDRALVGDDLVRPEAWDALRTRTTGPFAMARSRNEWERQADGRPEIAERCRAIDAWLEERRVRRLASYGVGGAVVELWLHRLRPERHMTLTDYAPEGVARLSRLFPEADVRLHDLLSDPPLDADLHLFHRVDTELTNEQWRTVLRRYSAEPVLVVVTEVLSLREIPTRLRALARQGRSRAGWVRNRDALESLFGASHAARATRFHDLHAWMLEPRA